MARRLRTVPISYDRKLLVIDIKLLPQALYASAISVLSEVRVTNLRRTLAAAVCPEPFAVSRRCPELALAL